MSRPYNVSHERTGKNLSLLVNICSQKFQVLSAEEAPSSFSWPKTVIGAVLGFCLGKHSGALKPYGSSLYFQLAWWRLNLVPMNTEPRLCIPKQESYPAAKEKAALMQNHCRPCCLEMYVLTFIQRSFCAERAWSMDHAWGGVNRGRFIFGSRLNLREQACKFGWGY